jgi:hypothetical protein
MGNFGGPPPPGYSPPQGYGAPPPQGGLIPCGACGNAVSPAALRCPRCGHPVPRLPVPATKSRIGPVVALVVIGVVIVAFGAVGYAVYASNTPTCGNYGAPPCPGDTPAQAQAAPAATPNEGNDPHAPVLSPDDRAFTDTRHGWGWSDHCYKEDGAGKYGWAMAACQKGLDLPDLDAKVKPLLLYNEGLALERGGDNAAARALYERSLALRAPNDSGRTEVTAALVRVGGAAPPTPRAAPVHEDECDPKAEFVRSGGCGFDGTGTQLRCCHAQTPRTACVGAGGSFPLTSGGLCEVPWLSCNAPEMCAE